MGFQAVLGVPYNILKFEVDQMNTFRDMAFQTLGPPPPHSEHFSVFETSPPVNRRTPIMKTLPSHHTSYVRRKNMQLINITHRSKEHF